ncbi:MAG: hypothetical protein WAV20_08195, partial [Blastocatellia bacterium]
MSTDPSNWQATNQRYLAAALNWLRVRLMRLVPEAAAPDFCESSLNQVSQARRRFWPRHSQDPKPPRALLRS